MSTEGTVGNESTLEKYLQIVRMKSLFEVKKWNILFLREMNIYNGDIYLINYKYPNAYNKHFFQISIL